MSSIIKFKEVSDKQRESAKEIHQKAVELRTDMDVVRNAMQKLSIEENIPDELKSELSNLIELENEKQTQINELKYIHLEKLEDEVKYLRSELEINIEETKKFIDDDIDIVKNKAILSLDSMKKIFEETSDTDEILEKINELLK